MVMSDKLSIHNEMRCFDKKDRDFYDSLSADELKKFSTYLMLKWGANIDADPDLAEYYLRATNERVNIDFFSLGRHKKLQWLLCTTVSPGLGTYKHYWIKAKSRESKLKGSQMFAQEFPLCNKDEIELLCKINDAKDIVEHAKNLGWDDRQIKDDL
jgi:hypothetical protein